VEAYPLFRDVRLLCSVEAFIKKFADGQRTDMRSLKRQLVAWEDLCFANIRAEPNQDR